MHRFPHFFPQGIHHRLVSHLALLTPDAKVESGEVLASLGRMAIQRLLLLQGLWGLGSGVALNVPKDDIINVIRQDPSLAAVHSQLG